MREHSLEIVGPGPEGTRVLLLDESGITIPAGSEITVGGNILDHKRVVNVFHAAAGTLVAGSFHIVDGRYVVESIKEVHGVAADAGGVLTIGVAKGTVTAANSTAQHSTALNLNGTANTVQTATITTQTIMDSGDRLCYKTVTNATNMVGHCLTVVLKRVA